MPLDYPNCSPSEHSVERKRRLLLLLHHLKARFDPRTWPNLYDILARDVLGDTSRDTFAAWAADPASKKSRTCSPDVLRAIETFERKTRPKDSPFPAALETTELSAQALDIAWRLRQFEQWDAIAPFSLGTHSYSDPQEVHHRWVTQIEVVRAMLDIEPRNNKERALAVVVGMRFGASIWNVGNASDYVLVRRVFQWSQALLRELQGRRVYDLREADATLTTASVQDGIAVAQHYCLEHNDELLQDFQKRILSGSSTRVQAQGISLHCVACAFNARAYDPGRPDHERTSARAQAMLAIDTNEVRQMCEQDKDVMASFYANAITGGVYASCGRTKEARSHLERAMHLRWASDTPAFVAYVLYYWAVVNLGAKSSAAIVGPAIAEATRIIAHEPLNLCVMPVAQLRLNIANFAKWLSGESRR